jgi:diaminopimelate epimerase
MRYKFTKMQSLGNDFVILNGVSENIRITPEIARFIADRHFGIGCDQILVVEGLPDNSDNKGYRLRIFNSDGSEVGQCGNGARCFAGYLRDQRLITGNAVSVKTFNSQLDLKINDDGTVTVGMGLPIVDPVAIPLAVESPSLTYALEFNGRIIEFSALSMGNPHCVLDVDDIETADVEHIGPALECHPIFPQKANIGFAHYYSRSALNLRVFERGAGETLGCGSGACAAAVAGIRRNILDRRVQVNLPGGSIEVFWPKDDSQVYLSGEIHWVFDGSIEV